MKYFDENTIIFLDGEYVKAIDARLGLYSESLHYGYAVFEGIRSYKTKDGSTKIFKAVEHYERLIASADALDIPFAYTVEELIAITYKILADNNLSDAYIRPLVFGPDNLTFQVSTTSRFTIQAWKMDLFFGEKLLKVMTSSFQRPNPKAFKMSAKASGHYVNSIMACHEAKGKGFDEAILADMDGFAAEASAANFFYEKDGKLYTPPLGHILPGITRATVFEIAADLGIEVIEKKFKIEEIYGADAAFFCGTAVEIIGFESLDNKHLAVEWNDSISKKIKVAYQDLVIR
jgi:branched-chain amino acid aminotransferase